MARKNKRYHIGTITAEQQFNRDKPRFNAWAVGHGVHGHTKYHRASEKARWRKEEL